MLVNIGVDAGQSQIRAAVSGRGAVSHRARVVTVDGVAHSDGDAAALVVARVADACSQLLQSSEELERIVLGLTTLPAGQHDILRLAEEIARKTRANEVSLTGDAVVAHAGALPAGHGVVMVVGTGIACLAVDGASGETKWVDGDGFLLGDNGASFWMGRHGIAAALASADGRGEATSLLDAAVERFGPVDVLAARLHAGARPVNEIAQFAAVVQEHAGAGDHIATQIVTSAASEIVATMRAAASIFPGRDNSPDFVPTPVAILGRAAAPGTVLREELERALAHEESLALVEPAGTPLDGACALAAATGATPYDRLITSWRAS